MAGAGWQEGPEGSRLLFLTPARASGPPSSSCSSPQAASSSPSPEAEAGGLHLCPHEPAWPVQHPTLEPSHSYFGSGAGGGGGEGRQGHMGASFHPYPPPQPNYPCFESIGGTAAPSRQCQHPPIHPSKGGSVQGATEDSLCASCPSSLPRPGQLPSDPCNFSGSTENGLSSNNVL